MVRTFLYNSSVILLGFLTVKCNGGDHGSPSEASKSDTSLVTDRAGITPEEARLIAKEAYIYGYPMIDAYRIQHAYFVDRNNTEFKAPYNVLANSARVFTADDKVVQTPNSDTPYGTLGLDLRTEPLVITVPAMEKNRYFSIQLVDAYTHNFEYIGSRTTGNDGGNYLIAGPDWKGELPKGIKKIIRCETQTALAIFRTQLFDPKDLSNVATIQKKYKAQPLSAFLGAKTPVPAPVISFVDPVQGQALRSSLEYFNVLNFLLQFCPVHPSETELMQRFSRIGIRPGVAFDSLALQPEIRLAIEQGRADAWKEFSQLKMKLDARELSSGELFGTRDELLNNYLYRMAGAIVGIFGNSKKEALYPIYTLDKDGAGLDGANSYELTFGINTLPPANAFWSLTMYELPSSLLTKNPINRYLINSPMLPQLKKNKDGGFTIYVQNASPGKAKEANWLPAPQGKFFIVLRLYWPGENALSGAWTTPPLIKMN